MTPKSITVLVDDIVVPAGDYRLSGKPSIRLVVVRRWFIAAAAPWMIGFTIFWNATALANLDVGPRVLRYVQLATGLFVAYVTLGMIFNRTRIAIESGVLSIRNGPLPWAGNRTVAIDQIDRFSREEVRGRKGSLSYKIDATLRTGGQLVLLEQLPDLEQARFIEELLTARIAPK